jgi:rhodanese-related sulfurtransferase
MSYRAIPPLAAVLLMALLPALAPPAIATETASPPHSPGPRVDRDLLLGFLADNDTLTLMDARSPEEYAEQHLPGAINIPFDAVEANAALLPADIEKPVVIYCRSGKRAGILAQQLIAKGYTDVQVLPREQMYWQDNFMAFNCSTESAGTVTDPPTRAESTDAKR